MKRIHCFQHVPFEFLGTIEAWIEERGYSLTTTRFFDGDQAPSMETVDWLIVMGGPMGADDLDDHPWLAGEKRAIGQAVADGKVVLGICLGAQLIAQALGADVRTNAYKEVGWFPVYLLRQSLDHPLAQVFPSQWPAFHWHGDTFDLPDGGRLLAATEACRNQLFICGERVVGMQFHMEVTPQGAAALVRQCPEDLAPAEYVSAADEILAPDAPFKASHALMARLLDYLDSV